MTTESNLDRLPPGRALRWALFFVFVLAAVTAYFLHGRHVPPFAAPPAGSSELSTR